MDEVREGDVYKRQVLNDYYGVYVTQPDDAKWRLDNMHEIYLDDMHSKYVLSLIHICS